MAVVNPDTESCSTLRWQGTHYIVTSRNQDTDTYQMITISSTRIKYEKCLCRLNASHKNIIIKLFLYFFQVLAKIMTKSPLNLITSEIHGQIFRTLRVPLKFSCQVHQLDSITIIHCFMFEVIDVQS